MLAVGTPGPEFEVELIEATAELPDRPAADLMPEGFGAKYRELLRRAGLTVQRFAEVYSQPIVLRPTRFLGYGGRGWESAAARSRPEPGRQAASTGPDCRGGSSRRGGR